MNGLSLTVPAYVQLMAAVGAKVMVAMSVLCTLLLPLVLGKAIIRAKPGPGNGKGRLALHALRDGDDLLRGHALLQKRAAIIACSRQE